MWFARFDLSCGFGAFFAGFFHGCSNGGVVGWWGLDGRCVRYWVCSLR